MNDIREGFFDRVGYSFELMFKNIKAIILPLFLYNFVTQIIIGGIFFVIAANFIDISALVQTPGDVFMNLWTNTNFIITVVIGIALLLLYLLLIIPFSFATNHAVKNAHYKVPNNLSENIIYGFSRFAGILRLYWYIFAYVALIPALIMIAGGLLHIVGLLYNIDILINISIMIISLSGCALLCFIVYRGTQTAFSLYNGVEKDNFGKDEFKKSIDITENKLWRIFWNLVFSGFIVGLLIGIVSMIINIGFAFTSSGGIQELLASMTSNGEELTNEEVTKLLSEMDSFSLVTEIQSTIILFLNTFQTTLLIVFIYVLYQRLVMESGNDAVLHTTQSNQHNTAES